MRKKNILITGVAIAVIGISLAASGTLVQATIKIVQTPPERPVIESNFEVECNSPYGSPYVGLMEGYDSIVYCFQITAPSNSDITINQLTFEMTGSEGLRMASYGDLYGSGAVDPMGGAVAVLLYQVEDEDNDDIGIYYNYPRWLVDYEIPGGFEAISGATAEIIFTFDYGNAPLEIPQGETYHYEVHLIPDSDETYAGDFFEDQSLQVSILEDSAALTTTNLTEFQNAGAYIIWGNGTRYYNGYGTVTDGATTPYTVDPVLEEID